MWKFIEHHGVNISRGNYQEAYSVEGDVLDTRLRLAKLFNVKDARNIIFTPGVTFSLNTFFEGFLQPGDHVVVSGMEHNAVMRPVTRLQQKRGVRCTIAEANERGEVPVEAFEKALERDTKAIVTLHASNVAGTLLPAQEIGKLCKSAISSSCSTRRSPLARRCRYGSYEHRSSHLYRAQRLAGPQGIGGFAITKNLIDEWNL